MGTMTVADDMTRLREEMDASQVARKDLVNRVKDDVNDLRAGMARMLADFHKTHSEMAKGTKADRQAFVSEVSDTVYRLLKEFAKTHSAMAKGTKADRQAFVSKVSDTIHRLRKQFATEMARAHKAFFGTAAQRKVAKKPAQATQKPRAPKKAKTNK